MRTIWLVIKHELKVTFRKRSFWLLTFLMPALLLGFNAYYVLLENDLVPERSSDASESTEAAEAIPTIGLVDEAGIITSFPEELPPGLFKPFVDETSARAALDGGEVTQYVHIPADYVTSGEVTVYDQDFQILESGANQGVAFEGDQEWALTYLINLNLTGEKQLVKTLRNPTPGVLARYHRLNPPDKTDRQGGQALAEVVARGIPYVYYFILIITSGYMLQSVTAEKENRTVEVLLMSLPPRQMMVGKILGLTVVIIVQIAVWMGGGVLALDRGAQLLNLSGFNFPQGFVVWAALFLVFGYLLYASAMAAAGAVANSAREGNQVTWILILPLLPTLMFSTVFLEEPHGTLSLVLSMFPFSAPSAMVTRMAVAAVPLWQILISLAGVVLTAGLMVTLASRFFRPHNLLSGSAFNWRRFATAWRE